jgi:hypothetical protein
MKSFAEGAFNMVESNCIGLTPSILKPTKLFSSSVTERMLSFSAEKGREGDEGNPVSGEIGS